MAKVFSAYLAFGATKPRNKIFALLGFTDSFANLNHVIDYDEEASTNSNILLQVANCIPENAIC
jgi:hypothetical protein